MYSEKNGATVSNWPLTRASGLITREEWLFAASEQIQDAIRQRQPFSIGCFLTGYDCDIDDIISTAFCIAKPAKNIQLALKNISGDDALCLAVLFPKKIKEYASFAMALQAKRYQRLPALQYKKVLHYGITESGELNMDTSDAHIELMLRIAIARAGMLADASL